MITNLRKNLAVGAMTLCCASQLLLADNPAYAPGDLVLGFQQEGGSNTVYVRLGNAALDFRGAATGPGADDRVNIRNISAELTSAFGAGWADATNIYAGLSGVWGTSGGLSRALQDGDPHRTLYVSKPRSPLGAPGSASSQGFVEFGDLAMSTGANAMTDQNVIFDTTYEGPVAVSPIGTSRIDDNNPFLAPGLQGTGYGIFEAGVQQEGSVGSLGAFGVVTNVEFALDLYRIQAKNNISGQVGNGEGLREPTFEGTVVVDRSGNVSFLSKPGAAVAPTIDSASPLPNGTVGVVYNQSLAASGGVTPYTWSLVSGALPTGMTLSSSGVLSGTPSNPITTATVFNFSVRVAGANAAESTKALSFTVQPAPAPAISTPSPLPAGKIGVVYNQTLAATGGATPYTWSVVAGVLPTGMTLSPAGVLSGTPSNPITTATVFNFTARVAGANAAVSTKALSFTMQPASAPAAPVLTFAANKVTMTSVTVGSVIRYTTNGAEPTAVSPVYNAVNKLPLASGKWTVKAKAFKYGIASATTTRMYTVYHPVTTRTAVKTNAPQADGRRFVSYATAPMSLARTPAAREVYLRLDLPQAVTAEGGQAAYYGLEVLRTAVLATDKIWYKFGGEAPYAGMPAAQWLPTNFSTIIDRPLTAGTYYFKIQLSGTTGMPATGTPAITVFMKYKVLRLLTNTGTPIANLAPATPLWLVLHGKAEGENAMRSINTSLRTGAGTNQVATVDWAEVANTAGCGRYFINLGRNLSALVKGKTFAKANVNMAGHSWGNQVGFETSFIFGGVNRFIAMDPALLAGGGYNDTRPNFRQQTLAGVTVAISTMSTGIKGGPAAGTLGSDVLSGACHYSLRLISRTHTGNLRNAAFYNGLPKDWLRRALTTTTDGYWPFMKRLLLTSQVVPWVGTDMGAGIDLECHGTTNFVDNTTPIADVIGFQNHQFVLLKNPSGKFVEARATKLPNGSTAWAYVVR